MDRDGDDDDDEGELRKMSFKETLFFFGGKEGKGGLLYG